LRPKTEKANVEQQKLEEEEVWKRRMKKGAKETEKEAVARDNSIIESDPPTQPLPYFTPPPLWIDSLSFRLPASSHVCRGPCQSQQCFIGVIVKGTAHPKYNSSCCRHDVLSFVTHRTCLAG